ncbi:MAG: hypothetical protein HY908_12155 [Myxococcales bacterium]|nr:hypothetical protein [Myxococcales bacterium]
MSAFEPIFRALEESGARYVVVGGLATVLHGYLRVTADVDLVVDLAEGEAIKPVAALVRIGMIPRAPVEAREFADAVQRRLWIEEKGMRVFSMWDPRRPLLEVDLFVDPPIPFDELRGRAEEVRFAGHVLPVACIDDLIAMKRLAGRAKDEEDIAALTDIRARRRS